MSVQYFVTAVSTCDRCNGAGYVQNAQWQRFFEKYGDAYRKAGIDDGANMLCGHFGVSSVRHLPTEEETCPECDGAGIVKRQVSLAEALQQFDAWRAELLAPRNSQLATQGVQP